MTAAAGGGAEAPGQAALAAQIEAVACLRDPVRRALYLHVARSGEASREQAAAAVGVGRSLAAFHLDKLVERGLLEASFRRPPGRAGRGAGRPAKRYRRAARELRVSLPARDYQLAAELLSRAVAGGPGDAAVRLRAAARARGAALGARARGRADPGAGGSQVAAAVALLAAHGFEPDRLESDGGGPGGGVVRLRNCPFHALARDQPELICGMTLALIEGVLAGLGADRVQARLDPARGRCCVVLAAGAGG
jgi:predicted ArsR family transcriptional regulator